MSTYCYTYTDKHGQTLTGTLEQIGDALVWGINPRDSGGATTDDPDGIYRGYGIDALTDNREPWIELDDEDLEINVTFSPSDWINWAARVEDRPVKHAAAALTEATVPAPSPLARVSRTAAMATAMQEQLRLAVIAAREAGEDIAAIADAAGVTRQTVYRWLNAETGLQDGPALPIIREAMRMLAYTYLPGYQASQVLARTGGDVHMLLRGMMMARVWITPQIADQLTDEDKALLGMAAQAEGRVRAALEAGKRVRDEDEV